MRVKSILIVGLLSVNILAGCSTVPFTGRSQAILISDAELTTMAVQNYADLKKETPVVENTPDSVTVKRVGAKLAVAVESFAKQYKMTDELKLMQWEFSLFKDDKTINAFCLPGGKVAFYTGIMPVANKEEYVAVVMGHEIAHAIARHGNERMSQQLMIQFGSSVLSSVLKEKPEQTKNIFMSVYGIGSAVAVQLPYSREHETEADHIGLILMARAGYNPNAAVPFWQRMKDMGGSTPPEILSTHPAPDTRIDNIRKFIPEAMPYYTGK